MWFVDVELFGCDWFSVVVLLYNLSGFIKLSFCLLINGLSLRIVNASYIKSLFVSLNCLTGHVFCCRSSKVEFCWCLSLKCSLIAPSLQCCSSLLLIVFLVMPMYEDVRSSQSSCGQVNIYIYSKYWTSKENFYVAYFILFLKMLKWASYWNKEIVATPKIENYLFGIIFEIWLLISKEIMRKAIWWGKTDSKKALQISSSYFLLKIFIHIKHSFETM